ncbi:hypothetical protein BGZ73_004082 [Actinomortierella ambigua]|nr:hypothetical protein BGZ73_004082 [Actinomortierella ambigua]
MDNPNQGRPRMPGMHSSSSSQVPSANQRLDRRALHEQEAAAHVPNNKDMATQRVQDWVAKTSTQASSQHDRPQHPAERPLSLSPAQLSYRFPDEQQQQKARRRKLASDPTAAMMTQHESDTNAVTRAAVLQNEEEESPLPTSPLPSSQQHTQQKRLLGQRHLPLATGRTTTTGIPRYTGASSPGTRANADTRLTATQPRSLAPRPSYMLPSGPSMGRILDPILRTASITATEDEEDEEEDREDRQMGADEMKDGDTTTTSGSTTSDVPWMYSDDQAVPSIDDEELNQDNEFISDHGDNIMRKARRKDKERRPLANDQATRQKQQDDEAMNSSLEERTRRALAAFRKNRGQLQHQSHPSPMHPHSFSPPPPPSLIQPEWLTAVLQGEEGKEDGSRPTHRLHKVSVMDSGLGKSPRSTKNSRTMMTAPRGTLPNGGSRRRSSDPATTSSAAAEEQSVVSSQVSQSLHQDEDECQLSNSLEDEDVDGSDNGDNGVDNEDDDDDEDDDDEEEEEEEEEEECDIHDSRQGHAVMDETDLDMMRAEVAFLLDSVKRSKEEQQGLKQWILERSYHEEGLQQQWKESKKQMEQLLLQQQQLNYQHHRDTVRLLEESLAAQQALLQQQQKMHQQQVLQQQILQQQQLHQQQQLYHDRHADSKDRSSASLQSMSNSQHHQTDGKAKAKDTANDMEDGEDSYEKPSMTLPAPLPQSSSSSTNLTKEEIRVRHLEYKHQSPTQHQRGRDGQEDEEDVKMRRQKKKTRRRPAKEDDLAQYTSDASYASDSSAVSAAPSTSSQESIYRRQDGEAQSRDDLAGRKKRGDCLSFLYFFSKEPFAHTSNLYGAGTWAYCVVRWLVKLCFWMFVSLILQVVVMGLLFGPTPTALSSPPEATSVIKNGGHSPRGDSVIRFKHRDYVADQPGYYTVADDGFGTETLAYCHDLIHLDWLNQDPTYRDQRHPKTWTGIIRAGLRVVHQQTIHGWWWLSQQTPRMQKPAAAKTMDSSAENTAASHGWMATMEKLGAAWRDRLLQRRQQRHRRVAMTAATKVSDQAANIVVESGSVGSRLHAHPHPPSHQRHETTVHQSIDHQHPKEYHVPT